MKLRNKLNGGTVTVSEKYAERLVGSGEWERVAAPKARKPKAAPKPKED